MTRATRGNRAIAPPASKERKPLDPTTAGAVTNLTRGLERICDDLENLLATRLPPGSSPELHKMATLADDLARRLRTVVDPGGSIANWARLMAALRRLTTDFARATGAAVDLRVRRTEEPQPLAAELFEVLFGVACETFRHIERHGRVSVVLVEVVVARDSITLDIRDDGLDLAQREADWGATTRLGVLTAAALVESIGGRLAITSNVPRGLRLVAEVPQVPTSP